MLLTPGADLNVRSTVLHVPLDLYLSFTGTVPHPLHLRSFSVTKLCYMGAVSGCTSARSHRTYFLHGYVHVLNFNRFLTSIVHCYMRAAVFPAIVARYNCVQPRIACKLGFAVHMPYTAGT